MAIKSKPKKLKNTTGTSEMRVTITGTTKVLKKKLLRN